MQDNEQRRVNRNEMEFNDSKLNKTTEQIEDASNNGLNAKRLSGNFDPERVVGRKDDEEEKI